MGDPDDLSAQPMGPVNGHTVRSALLTGDLRFRPTIKSNDREATRYLSAATQVDLGYARKVVTRVISEPFRALAPTFGVDIPVVARWALKAVRTRARRDFLLAATLAMMLLLLAAAIFDAWILLSLPVLLAAAWVTVSWEHWERIHNTVTQKMLRDRFDPGSAPSPTDAAVRGRLEEVEKRREGNLVVFSGHSAFVGSGKTRRYQRILLDVSRGVEGEDDVPSEPDPFTSQEVHAAIVQAFGCENGLARSLPHIKVYERLFVNGLHNQYNNRLLPDPFKPPPTSVAPELLTAAAQHPTPEARAYVCVEMPGWHGQLVVTLFIRAVHTGESLYIDWTFRILPPLRDDFLYIDRFFEMSQHRQVRRSLRAGLRETLPALIRSPHEVLRIWRRPKVELRKRSRQTRAIARGYVFDYGARRSIREEACGTGRQHYFLARDETMYMLLAEQTLTRAIATFLKDHHVSLGQLEAQVKLIFDNSINIGSIENSTGVTVGNDSSTNVNTAPKGEK
jgi:hypothetical protein